MEFHTVRFVQPRGQGSNCRGWVNATFRLAPEATEQSVWVCSGTELHRFARVQQSQMFTARAMLMQLHVFLEDLPFIFVVGEV
jgi:hypothetical protein